MELVYSRQFLKSAKKLPQAQQKKLAVQLELLQKQPFSSLLHTKPLSGKLAGYYSFRITRDWRVIFQFQDPITIKLIDTAHRRDIYR